ncbi:MAG: S-layer homology domain-containing protein, partial [Synergistaceae bacterium]|nr:S-layer homology domain-containing protein [Synergistaceae bacterium]
SEGRIRDIYMSTMLPYDLHFRVGRILTDVEGDHDFYTENDAIFTDFRYDGFEFKKTWGNFSGMAFVGRNTNREHSLYDTVVDPDEGNFMAYGLNLDYATEKWFMGAAGYWFQDDEVQDVGSWGFSTYNVYAGFNFTPAVSLRGTYYFQNLDRDLADTLGFVGAEDNPRAWKAVLNFDQSMLKFTSLRFEYSQTDNMFYGTRDYYGLGADTGQAPSAMTNMPYNNGSTKVFWVRADQKWNDKWSTFLRYYQADFDTAGLDDSKSYAAAITYQYTPAIAFRLIYDLVDYGSGNTGTANNGKDHVVQFRTTLSF